MDWDKLKTFHFAADAGSLTSAAEKLGVSQSAVSRQIAALEAQIGVPLFQRHARGLMLTAQGEALKTLTDDMAAASNRADSAIADARDRVMGELRVTAPVAFGTTWLAARMGGFADLYPELRVQLMLDDREYDLLKLEAECALRLWPASQADLIQRKLFDVHVHLYASASYIDQRGEPRTPADLDQHRILAYRNPPAVQLASMDWAARLGREDKEARPAALEMNNILSVTRAVEAGFGVGALPDYITRGRPNIVRVLPDYEGPKFEAFFVYPSDLKRSRRIVAFRQYLIDQARDWTD
jgi:DNA-binding transcriptional LysR family regulator